MNILCYSVCKSLCKKCKLRYFSLISIRFKCVKPKGPPWSILFFGTDNFSVHSLKSLWAKLNTGTIIHNLGVVSKPSSPIRKFSEAEGLVIYDWPLQPEDIESKYDLGIVVSFGKMIPPEIISAFPLGCLNVHSSILPRWRGAAPVIHAVMNGDSESGISVMKIHPHRFDVGEIVRQYRIAIGENEKAKEVEERLAVCGAGLLMECIRDLPRCIDTAIPQPRDGITYAPRVNSSMAWINWKQMTSLQIYNLYRALNHLYPLSTHWHGRSVKFMSVSLDKFSKQLNVTNISSSRSAIDFLNNSQSQSPKYFFDEKNSGKVTYIKSGKILKVLCCDGNYIFVDKLLISGKHMNAVDFYNGFMSKKCLEHWSFRD